VLPMGHSSERHDINSYETHAGQWIAFRQPVLREQARREGRQVKFTYEVNPGEVWEEDEFWIELSWRIDDDNSMGIRKHFISPYRKGEKITIDEYYQYMFEHTEGLPEKAAEEGLSPLDYMRKYGAFLVKESVYHTHLSAPDDAVMAGSTVESDGTIVSGGVKIGIQTKDGPATGFPTPSRRQEFYSASMSEFGWDDQALPGYIKSHIHPDNLAEGEFALTPTFRLPTHIHSRSANSKWLTEIAHRNPIWVNTGDAKKLGVKTGDLLKMETEIGYFIDKVWATEAIRPGVVACSHHIGRWRRQKDSGNRWMTNTVTIEQGQPGIWKMSTVEGVKAFKSSDKDSLRIWWRDGGVHQNITHAVHPDPISGAHCWHQKVKLTRPAAGEKYGDIVVDTNKSHEVFKQWNALAKARETHPGGLRRPLWLGRPLTPAKEHFYIRK
ncbi:MAG: formate dehydrogenase, partial [Candidatus Marinimicrobia bacterium]|nr:formate dehydrogenase [Candidatus Neomarinimicrobiota bacterium]